MSSMKSVTLGRKMPSAMWLRHELPVHSTRMSGVRGTSEEEVVMVESQRVLGRVRNPMACGAGAFGWQRSWARQSVWRRPRSR